MFNNNLKKEIDELRQRIYRLESQQMGMPTSIDFCNNSCGCDWKTLFFVHNWVNGHENRYIIACGDYAWEFDCTLLPKNNEKSYLRKQYAYFKNWVNIAPRGNRFRNDVWNYSSETLLDYTIGTYYHFPEFCCPVCCHVMPLPENTHLLTWNCPSCCSSFYVCGNELWINK